MDDRKSNKTAELCRNDGNRLYVKKKFFDAIIKYNESLCYAEENSENLGLAYANRSAVYFEMKLYEKSLTNIELARISNYPVKNQEILKKRESKCQELMKIQPKTSNDQNVFKLSYAANKKCQSIVDCVEMKSNSKYGRYIVTNRPLSVGDVLAIEDPAYKLIKSDDRYSTCYANNVYQRCANCLLENLLDLIPCASCTKTMFCSANCMDYSMTHHHKYECLIIDDLLKSGLRHAILRVFFEGLSALNHNVGDLAAFIRQNENKSLTYFDFIDMGDGKDLFLATMSLASKDVKIEKPLDFEDLFSKSKLLSCLWMDNENVIRNILKVLNIVGNRDVHGIGAWSLKHNGMDEHDEPKNPSQYQQLIGNACYLFSSLLNHSCAPNVKRLNYNCKNVIVVSRPIGAGEQLFDSYRQNFNLMPKVERQDGLLRDYGFICDCEACDYDWPLNKDLDVIDDGLLEYAWEAHEQLPYLSSNKNVVKKLKEYFEKFTKHHKKYPSAELIILQECISNCLLSITKPSFQFC